MTARPGTVAEPDAPARARTHAVRVLLAAYLLAVAAVTLGPAPADPGTLGLVERVVRELAARGLPVTYLGVEAVANVVMFLPFGVLVTLVLPARAWWVVVPAALATSAAIETAQRWLPTRVPTVQDVVLNTLGAALGLAGLAAVRRSHRRRQAPSAARIGPSVK